MNNYLTKGYQGAILIHSEECSTQYFVDQINFLPKKDTINLQYIGPFFVQIGLPVNPKLFLD